MQKLLGFTAFIFLVSISLAVMMVTVIPISRFMDQKDTERQARTELSDLEQENKELKARIRSYKKDSSIERLAREEYNLVYPGQQVFVLLP